MITFDFDYYKPETIEEALNTFRSLTEQGKKVIYYAGGTEIIGQARVNQIHFNGVIDIKGIPECNVFGEQNDKLVVGAAITLTKISDSGFIPFLSESCRKSADHTARDKITIGGNICGKTPYKEAILPLLLTDCEFVIAGVKGMKTLPVTQAFNKELKLDAGEFLVQIIIDKNVAALPYASVKKTKHTGMDYPLITAALIEKDNKIRAGFSGLCSFPFRCEAELDINEGQALSEEAISKIMSRLPCIILDDILGTAEYRKFVAGNALHEAWDRLKGVNNA